MKLTSIAGSNKERFLSFLWQHVLLLFSLFVMTFGVALCLRSNLGCSVISTIPYVMTLAGKSYSVPALSIGEYTYLMNFLLVGLQILVLRRRFELLQLFQLVIGFVFGYMLDVNMWLTSSVVCESLLWQCVTQMAGCLVLAIGISLEIRCGSVTMPGEGLPVAISRVSGIRFARVKIMVDVTLVLIAIGLSFFFFGQWLWNVVGVGTIIAMVLVGAAVRFFDPYMGWFERVLHYRPGFRRYLYGLARFVYQRRKSN
ncbi:MAG: hypothetical protein K2G94_05785 [Muribaculaceae bacterium]|nr:hypothetical protein [Muribaculaceae bacterium]MDE6461932.1 hypothetical protein [Muribaculaceae bacterium]